MQTSLVIESEIIDVERRLFSIKDELAQLADVATDVSLSAADQRARHAEMGRGLGGALLGAKYRAAARRAAASGNAAVSREVAAKRRTIAEAKQMLREEERDLRWKLRDLKADLRDAKVDERAAERAAPQIARIEPPPTIPPVPPAGAAPLNIKDELRRLKALFEQGKLDAANYEKARIELLQPHLR